MEFKYHADHNQRIPSPMSLPFSATTYVSENQLQGSKFAPSSFPVNVPTLRALPMPVPSNVEEEAFRREMEIRWVLEKEEIRRDIMANEIALARRQELEEEVRSEIAAERALGMPMQRPGGITFRRQVSMPLNNRAVNHTNVFGGPKPQLPLQIDTRQPFTQSHINTYTNRDNIIILAKPDIDHYGAKRKAEIPPTLDDNKHSPCNLQKKPKQGWNCSLCQVTTTSEKGLNDHLQGKKHKAKEASSRTQKIGLDTRPDR